MAKRKYARMGEKVEGYQCTNNKCKWQGLSTDKIDMPINSYSSESVCPKCGNNEFYGLLHFKALANES